MFDKKVAILSLTVALALTGVMVLLWLSGEASVTLAQAGTGVICVATTGSDAPGCGSQASPCRTVQYAVNQAGAGDEVRVAAGTYTGVQTRGGARQLVYISKTITIRGGYDDTFQDAFPLTQPTVLDAEGEGRVIHIVFESPTVEGFWITGGNASHALFDEGRGGGIYSNGGAPIIVNNVISGNVAYTSTSSSGHGGGIYVWDVWSSASVVISGNQVISNVASTSYRGDGGGIRIGHAPAVQVINNVVLSNTGSITGGYGRGGGIHLSDSSGAIVDGNRVAHNVAQAGSGANGYGGGIYVYDSDEAVLSDNVLDHNIVGLISIGGYGGGIFVRLSEGVHVKDNTLEGNRGTEAGGGNGGGFAALDSHDLLLSGNKVLSNSANRGGLYISSDASFTMTNNIVARNVGSYQGGGLVFHTSTGETVIGTLLHNTFAANNQGSGEGRSAIHTRDPDVSLVLTNNLIYSHTYGIIVVPASTVRAYNTLFYANDSDTSGSGEVYNTAPVTGEDPLLNADYHLQEGSAAIDAGVDAGVTTDIDGEPRPFGTSYDIGADEFAWRYIYLPLVVRNCQP